MGICSSRDTQQELPHVWVAALDDEVAKEWLKDKRHKVVRLMRIGECQYITDETLVGSRLTDEGSRQCAGKLRGPEIELVMCSPMMRCLDTVMRAFEEEEQMSKSLSVGNDEDFNAFVRQVSATVPPVEAFEELRTRMLHKKYTQRKSITELTKTFGDVNFSSVKSDEDPWWKGELESRDDLDARAGEFARLMMARKERDIAIVTHSTFLLAMLSPSSDHSTLGKNGKRKEDDPAIFDASRATNPEKISSEFKPGEVREYVVIPKDD